MQPTQLSNFAARQELPNLRNNLANAYRPVKHSRDARQRYSLGA